MDSEEGEGLQSRGYYAHVAFFPTGESRPYATLGFFGSVRCKPNFSLKDRTCGGDQLQAGYSHLDSNDRNVQGGRTNIVSAGLTRHLSLVFRLMFNYGYVDIDNRETDVSLRIFQTRLEVEPF